MFLDTAFKFDVDGGPDSGRALAGTYVEIHLQNGTILTGVTFPDDTGLNRSITGW